MKKRVLPLLLATLLILGCFPLEASAASYPGNWWEWSQKYSSYSTVKSGGCRMVAQAKLLKESGAITDPSFNPDVYFQWMANNGYVVSINSVAEYSPTGNGMIQYAAEHGVTIRRIVSGQSIRGMSLESQKSLIMSYINQGYYVIVDGDNQSDHQTYVMSYNSKYYGYPEISDSGSGISNTCKAYTGYYSVSTSSGLVNYPFSSLYVYQVSQAPVSVPVSVSVTTGEASNITDTSATLHVTAQATGTSLNYVGIRLGESTNNMRIVGYQANLNTSVSLDFNTQDSGTLLEPGHMYYYQAFATTNEGAYKGETKTFWTNMTIDMDDPTMTLSYDANGGTGSPSEQSLYSSQNGGQYTFTISSTVPTREGYQFLGWAESPTATSAGYQPGDSITLSASATLYAVWQAEPAVDLVEIDYKNQSIAVTTGMQWTDDPDSSSFTTALWDEDLIIHDRDQASYGIYFGNTLYFRDFVDGAYTSWQKLEIPNRPAAPANVVGTFGKITGVTSQMEYRSSGESQWKTCPQGEITGLTSGTYQVRTKSTATTFASLPATVQVPANGTFSDVDPQAWYQEAVEFVSQKGIMNGVGAGIFQPLATLDRSQAVQILYNLEGKPAVTGSSGFHDVSGWYEDAVVWASQNQIVSGVGNGRFAPQDQVTREQFAQMLFNYAKWKGYNTAHRTDLLSRYPDGSTVSSWAKDAVSWANQMGLINGSDGKILPAHTASRAQVASILKGFWESVVF